MDTDCTDRDPGLSVPAMLDRVAPGKPQLWRNMAVFPLELIPGRTAVDPEADGEPPVSLDSALRDGRAEALETGRIPRVRIRNRGRRPLLVAAGDTLIGGAQNRIVSFPALIQPGEAAELTAACVEVRRWDLAGGLDLDRAPDEVKTFRSSALAPARLRRLAAAQAFDRAERGLEPEPDQNLLWALVAQYFSHHKLKSETLDIHEVYSALEPALDAAAARFAPARGQLGAVTVLDRRRWSLDLFADPRLYRDRHARLMRSGLVDALTSYDPDAPRQCSPPPTLPEARAFVRGFKVARQFRYRLPTGAECLFFSARGAVGMAAAGPDRIPCLFACGAESEAMTP